MGTFEIRETFYLNGKPFQIISGSIHYFRVVPEYWRDRLEKLCNMGCNTVETYIPWNVHEPKKGEFHFEGMANLTAFIELAQELGLYVILRPSPYICAEWEFGGLPAWLLNERDIRLRVNNPVFLRHIREYYEVLFPKIIPYQIDHGGRVILMQLENEYGYYGNDKTYLAEMKKLMEELGVTVPMITSDGVFSENLRGGTLDGVLPTGNFGSRAEERFATLKKFSPNSPAMCSEFWVGWFDHWGNGGHKTGDLEQNVLDFDALLRLGHVNIYMFEGGTNFGFMNGSNYYDALTPDVTSYDYDAILTEDGQLTEKYRRFRETVQKYAPVKNRPLTTPIQRKSYGTIQVQEKVSLFSTLETLSEKIHCVCPTSMERLGQNYGYILYRTRLHTEGELETLRLWGANDRASVLTDGKPLVTLYDRELLEEVKLSEFHTTAETLDILVENMGRVNFGAYMELQRKGIDHCVQINGHMHHHWDIYCLPLDNVEKIDFSGDYEENQPSFYRFSFEVQEKGDTFLDFEGWGKGCAFLNGFNLGRFWEIGPQKRLYIPAPLLKKGENELILFETEGKHTEFVTLEDKPNIGERA